MQTKHAQLSSGVGHLIIQLFYEFSQLKNLYRQGWLQNGVSEQHCETVAEHSFGVALLGYILAEEYRPDLNSGRVMKLGLFHDVAEIHAGDITPQDGVSLEEKSAREYAAVQRIFSHMPDPQKYVDIWQEYEQQRTPEARFVKEVDRLEMALQAHVHERIGYTGLDAFFPWVDKRINSPELRPILEELLRMRT